MATHPVAGFPTGGAAGRVCGNEAQEPSRSCGGSLACGCWLGASTAFRPSQAQNSPWGACQGHSDGQSRRGQTLGPLCPAAQTPFRTDGPTAPGKVAGRPTDPSCQPSRGTVLGLSATSSKVTPHSWGGLHPHARILGLGPSTPAQNLEQPSAPSFPGLPHSHAAPSAQSCFLPPRAGSREHSLETSCTMMDDLMSAPADTGTSC